MRALVSRGPIGSRVKSVKRPSILALSALLLLACSSGPPAKAASGELIESVTYEERFALSTDVHEVKLTGDRLRQALPLMDRAEVTAMSGDFVATGVMDRSTLVFTVRNADQHERRIVLKNCAEPHVCTFLAAAFKDNLIDKMPLVCRDGGRCIEP
ncbi:hypothetical protein BH11MYX4_BH11MYX4_56620 [soil metagenome]